MRRQSTCCTCSWQHSCASSSATTPACGSVTIPRTFIASGSQRDGAARSSGRRSRCSATAWHARRGAEVARRPARAGPRPRRADRAAAQRGARSSIATAPEARRSSRCSRTSASACATSCSTALESERYFELLDAFESAVASLRGRGVGSGCARDSQAGRLPQAAPGGEAARPDPADAELHALRISAKRARYAAELAAAGRTTEAAGRYLDALKELQDVVGEHQDAVVAEATLRKLARARTALAAGRLIERERAPAGRAAAALPGGAGGGARPGPQALRLMPLLLVRHGSAGDRGAWEGDDRQRPLDKRGRRDAKDLVERLAPFKIEAILTSPYRRCLETVGPLARARRPRSMFGKRWARSGSWPRERRSCARSPGATSSSAGTAVSIRSSRRRRNGRRAPSSSSARAWSCSRDP